MIAIATILLTVAHPGLYFPEISGRYVRQQRQLIEEEGDGHGMESIGGVGEKRSIDKEVTHESVTRLGHHGHSPSASDEEAILPRDR